MLAIAVEYILKIQSYFFLLSSRFSKDLCCL